jgi:hypothetical protein
MSRQFIFAHSLALVLLVICVICVHWMLGGTTVDRWCFYRFNTLTWSIAGPDQRYHMAQYLLDSHGLIGKSRTEISDMLGRPDSDNTDATASNGTIQYSLGSARESLFSLGGNWLHLSFSSNSAQNNVISARIIRSD